MTEPQIYWLYFEQGQHWTRHFCKKGFSHLSILFMREGRWVILNPNKYQLEVYIFKEGIEPSPLPEDVRILKVITVADKTKSVNMRPLCGLWCTTIIKYATGIGGWSVTPYGLYKELCAMAKYGNYSHGVQSVEII